MAINEHKRLNQAVVETDRAALLALKKLNDYAPSNAAISTQAVSTLEVQLREAEENDILTTKSLAAARDARATAEWALHNAMLSVKATVIGQYGANSNAIQALGLKKKADYRRPMRRRASVES
jgi:hypothetical protein